eukprot:scaffold158841_cov27-Attheya_sp.AAC.2
MTISDEAFVLLVLENNWDVLNGVANAEPKYIRQENLLQTREMMDGVMKASGDTMNYKRT